MMIAQLVGFVVIGGAINVDFRRFSIDFRRFSIDFRRFSIDFRLIYRVNFPQTLAAMDSVASTM